jgi:hypothetical protein
MKKPIYVPISLSQYAQFWDIPVNELDMPIWDKSLMEGYVFLPENE